MATFDFQTGKQCKWVPMGFRVRELNRRWVRFNRGWALRGRRRTYGNSGRLWNLLRLRHVCGQFVALLTIRPFFTISVFFPSALSLITLANPFATTNGFVPPAALSILRSRFQARLRAALELQHSAGCGAVGRVQLRLCGIERNDLPRSLDINQPFPGAEPLSSVRLIRLTATF